MSAPVDGLPWVWGATPEEAGRGYPADTALGMPVRLLTRAVGVAAPPAHVHRWTCQVALAPYSYDWIDNYGRRSPRHLVPGTERLELGQVMTRTFRVTAVEPGHSWTGVMLPEIARVFGPTALTYAAEPARDPAPEPAARRTRLVCRLAVGDRHALDRIRGRALAWGDLVMMRRQLLNLKELAEASSPDEEDGSNGP